MQNLMYYCRQRIEAFADKQCKCGCLYRVRFEHIQSASKVPYESLSNLKNNWNERISCQKTYTYFSRKYTR